MKKTIYLLTTLLLLTAVHTTAQELNIASYNIRLLTDKDTAKGNGWEHRKDALCDLIRFSDFDIFGAQEVRHPQLTDMLDALDGYDYIGVGRDDGHKKGEYSPIFYKRERFKVLDSGTFWISETPDKVSFGWDAVCRRVCSWGHMLDRESKTKFWFFNIHMDHKGKEARREGSKLVLERIRQMCGEDANVILTGDFNVPQTNEIYKIFSESGLLFDSYEIAKVRFAPTGTFNGFDPAKWTDRRIDYIWVSSRAKVSRYGVLTYHYWSDEGAPEVSLADFPDAAKAKDAKLRLPSDHYPINAFVTFLKR